MPIESASPLALPAAVIFDLDGVLTDTADLHYRSWQFVADELGVPFDRQRNEALRGLSREESLAKILGPRLGEFTAERQRDITRRKNDEYLRLVAAMSPADLFPGASELLAAIAAAGVPTAVASSSRNAEVVLERLRMREAFRVVIDGNLASRSKPDPQVFLEAAKCLGVAAAECVVVEDAESGVQAGLAAGMRVIGLGPRERVGAAHRVVDAISQVTLELIGEVYRR
ncbi:MAG: beta-phosphoglucomutase [Phycisphaerae bacterium]